MDSDVVQLHNGNRLVTDITEVILSSVATAATGCVTSLFRMRPPASR
jgi:hypothetical protein